MIRRGRGQWHSLFDPSRRVKYRFATLVWATALLIASLQPKRPANFHFSVAHHIAHFLSFGALAFVATVGFGNFGNASLWSALGCCVFGFTIECLQHLQFGMPVEWHDVRDDAIGIIAFVIICHVTFWRIVEDSHNT